MYINRYFSFIVSNEYLGFIYIHPVTKPSIVSYFINFSVFTSYNYLMFSSHKIITNIACGWIRIAIHIDNPFVLPIQRFFYRRTYINRYIFARIFSKRWVIGYCCIKPHIVSPWIILYTIAINIVGVLGVGNTIIVEIVGHRVY